MDEQEFQSYIQTANRLFEEDPSSKLQVQLEALKDKNIDPVLLKTHQDILQREVDNIQILLGLNSKFEATF
jgi:hypothetical protein